MTKPASLFLILLLATQVASAQTTYCSDLLGPDMPKKESLCKAVSNMTLFDFAILFSVAVREQGGSNFGYSISKDKSDGSENLWMGWVSEQGDTRKVSCSTTQESCNSYAQSYQKLMQGRVKPPAPPGFSCPHTLSNDAARARELTEFVNWITQTFNNMTVEQIIDYRLYVLKEYGCSSDH